MLNSGRRGRAGSVAVEMALVVPMLAVMSLAAFDLIDALTAWRRVRASAAAIAEIATNLAINTSSSTNQLTSTQTQTSSTAIFAYMPYLLSGGSITYAVALSGVVFTPVTGCSNGSCGCVTTNTITNATSTAIGTASSPGTTGTSGNNSTQCYTANTAWSRLLTQGQQGATYKRACTILTPVGSSTANSETTLPVGLYGPYSLLVADVSYTFTPTFLNYIMGNITFLESAYVPPRIGTAGAYVEYTPTTTPPVCTGYL